MKEMKIKQLLIAVVLLISTQTIAQKLSLQKQLWKMAGYEKPFKNYEDDFGGEYLVKDDSRNGYLLFMNLVVV